MLFVVSGTGAAVVQGKQVQLRRGTLLLIERGEQHEVRNTCRLPLRTPNIYVPPAYNKDGALLARGKSTTK